MLGNRHLGVAVQAQGTVKDIGGQVVYQNLERRWNWGASAARIPFLIPRTFPARLPDGSIQYTQRLFRIFDSSALGLASYPLSSTRRIDLTGGVNRISFDLEEQTIICDPFGRCQQTQVRSVEEGVPDPVNLFQTSMALVGDNSFFGFTSPIRGSRYRAQIQNTVGSINYQTLILDYRRYLNPHRNLTLAFRGMHRGRYGSDVQQSILQPYFLGWETNIRGYSQFSFEPSLECTPSQDLGPCPQLQRLEGHRIGVANAEIRIPFLGNDQLGVLDVSFLPTELVAFADAGIAWDEDNEPNLTWSTTSLDRIPVFSTGVGARFNLMGMMIFEFYYARPWQRPQRGSHWGFQLAPGW